MPKLVLREQLHFIVFCLWEGRGEVTASPRLTAQMVMEVQVYDCLPGQGTMNVLCIYHHNKSKPNSGKAALGKSWSTVLICPGDALCSKVIVYQHLSQPIAGLNLRP